MKTNFFSLLFLLLSSFSVCATLSVRGNGLIYDDVLDVTWLQDANYANTTSYVTSNGNGRNVALTNGQMNWDEAVEWAEQLNYAGFTEWRLPTVQPINGSFYDYNVSYTGETDFGEHITSPLSQMSYMYFVNLGNDSVHDSPFGCGPTALSSCLENTGDFDNLISYNYWTGTEVENDSTSGWSFNTQHGIQTPYDNKPNEFHAWAVHSGDIAAVPLPASIWLLASAIIGLTRFKNLDKNS